MVVVTVVRMVGRLGVALVAEMDCEKALSLEEESAASMVFEMAELTDSSTVVLLGGEVVERWGVQMDSMKVVVTVVKLVQQRDTIEGLRQVAVSVVESVVWMVCSWDNGMVDSWEFHEAVQMVNDWV